LKQAFLDFPDITVQKIYLSEDSVVAEDYPFSLERYNNHYLLNFEAE